jgi:hypothetical protein
MGVSGLERLTSLLRLLLSTAVLLGVLRFVGKTTIEHWLNSRLEKLRQELRIAEAQRGVR